MSFIPYRLAAVSLAASLSMSVAPLAGAQDPVLEGTVFSEARLEETRNNRRLYDFFRCNCSGAVERNQTAIRSAPRIRATNINAIEVGRSGDDFQIRIFERSGSYARLLRLLGVAFRNVGEEAAANFVVDYSWTNSQITAGQQPLHHASPVCAVLEQESGIRVGIDADLETQRDDFYAEVARCYAVGFLGVFGFSGFAEGEPFDVSERNPPDANYRVVYRDDVHGFLQSFETQCAMALYRLLENGSHSSDAYYDSLRIVSDRLAGRPRHQCLPTRAVILDQVEEERAE